MFTRGFDWHLKFEEKYKKYCCISSLYEIECETIKLWYLRLYVDEANWKITDQGSSAFLTLGLPVCKCGAGAVMVRCKGTIRADRDGTTKAEVPFNVESVVNEGKNLVLVQQPESKVLCLTDDWPLQLRIRGFVIFEEENGSSLVTSSANVKSNNLSTDLHKLLEEQVYGDVTLVAEGRELLAYKGILAARSPVFAAMFQNDMKEKRDSRVEIDDIPYEVLKEMVRYMYTEGIPNLNISEDLFAAADKYQLNILKQICEDILCTGLTVSNVAPNLALAVLHNGTRLKAKAIEFILCNKNQVFKSEEWMDALAEYPVLDSVLPDLQTL